MAGTSARLLLLDALMATLLAGGIESPPDAVCLLQSSFRLLHATGQHRQGAALLHGAGCNFVEDPEPVSEEQMRAVRVDGMTPVRLGGSDAVIYAYEKQDDQFVSGSLEETGGWETDLEDQLCAEFDKVDPRVSAHFMDVGANIGAYSVPMAGCLARKGRSASAVIAIEGMPSIAEHLEASVLRSHLQDRVDIYDYALSDDSMAADSVEMNLSPSNKGGSSVLGNKPRGLVEGDQVQDGEVVPAKVTTLDSILKRNPKLRSVLVMKMDIEGSEGRALKGARRMLAECPPCVLQLELNTDWLARAGTPIEAVLDTLRGAGYDVPADPPVEEMSNRLFRQRDFEACLARLS